MILSPTTSMAATECPSVPGLAGWLVEVALPLWSRHGVDHRNGGFYEKLAHDLTPIEEPRRARLVSRQIYCFAMGHELGWTGPAAALVDHGLQFLQHHLLKEDGTVIACVNADGSRASDGYDPCDYAFVLLALATAARRLGDGERLHRLATAVRNRLVVGWAHTLGGFREALPLKANSQMHLFEAFLAWDALVGQAEPSWRRAADQLGSLALQRLIDPATGALPEFFDDDWQPCAGGIIEPGHQFEWSWLLARWSRATGRRDAFLAARQLADIGESHGVDALRDVAINALDRTLQARDKRAGLWPQTERIKAWHEMSVHPMSCQAERIQADANLLSAISGLERYFLKNPAGLWHEVMGADGLFLEGPAKASSFYHLSCAIHALASTARQTGRSI